MITKENCVLKGLKTTTRAFNTVSANNDVVMTTRGISRLHSSRDLKSQIELG